MMAGMGEEEVYRVTLDIRGKEGADVAETKGGMLDFDDLEADACQVADEVAGGDEEDPFAMMAGMGEEEVYKVTLDIKGKECAEGLEAGEKEADEHGENEGAAEAGEDASSSGR